MSTDPSIPTPILETERLTVRASTPADADLHFELWTDPRVMRFVGFPDGLAVTREGLEEMLGRPRPSEYDRPLVAALKETGERIGECKLGTPNEEGVAGTDVKLLPRHWGHRFGVEIKQALVDYLFTHTDCDSVQGEPNLENVASIRMQEAVGGKRVGEAVCTSHIDAPGAREPRCAVHHHIYRVFRSDWEAARRG